MDNSAKNLLPLFQLPPIAGVAIGLMLGMAAVEFVDATAMSAAAALAVVLIYVTCLSLVPKLHGFRAGIILVAVMLCGFIRGHLSPLTLEVSRLQHLCHDGPTDVVVEGRIASTPILHRRPLTALAPRMYGPPQQSRFVLGVSQVRVGDTTHTIDSRCRTYVSGRVAETLSAGDRIRVSGRLDWPKSPGNPGEFDFPAFLLRHNIDGMLFVDIKDDLTVVSGAGPLDCHRWLSWLRAEFYRILARYVQEDVRGIANALLLGSRHELPPETQHAFMASGTMHLLAISGLHVGILWVASLQLLHVLLVPRRRALVLTLSICIVYALLTDLRPSVFRATVFLAIFVVGQLVGRDQRMSALLALTAIVMLMYDPTLVFEVGSWLSFLSVAALGWLSTLRVSADRTNDVPADAVTISDRLRELRERLRSGVWLRYRQTLAILFFTTPLVAATFHVVSPIGIILNVALIPMTAVVLCLGFLTLATGLLLPILAAIPGYAFSGMLSLLVATVSMAADIPGSHFFLAQLPPWFLPTYYAGLICFLVSRSKVIRITSAAMVATAALLALVWPTESSVDGLRCTVLDVGQGNGVIVECSTGEVFIVDAGAEGRAMRSADAVSNYLWSRGIRRVDAILISHPDLSHCNALPGILSRFEVDRVMLSREFQADDHPATYAILDRIAAAGSELVTIGDGDVFGTDDVSFRILQAKPQLRPDDATSDELSLVVELKFQGRSILLPADLKGRTADDVLANVASPTVLLSAGHGSKVANTPSTGGLLRPANVVVSSRDAANREFLESTYSPADSIWFTSEYGAVTVQIDHRGTLKIDGFRKPVAGSADEAAAEM